MNSVNNRACCSEPEKDEKVSFGKRDEKRFFFSRSKL